MKNKFFISVIFLIAVLFICEAKASSAPVPVANQIVYSKADPESIAKAFWAMTDVKSTENNMVDMYLMITECELYKTFSKNDMEWNKIRSATAKYIDDNKSTFPRRFEFIQPVFLGPYDPAAGGFPLVDSSRFVGVKKIQMSSNKTQASACTDSPKYDQKLLPINAALLSARPFNYSFVKTNKASADEYVKYLEDKNINIQHGRPAYIRYRVKIQQSLGFTPLNTINLANFYGAIESIAIFGDRELFIKLDEQTF